jgi:YegS/Rv2252/BmrU family lipid kinase
MQRAVILYNPQSGLGRARRRSDVERAAAVLRASGVRVHPEPTTGRGTAGQQARNFIRDGYDSIIAGGGDGTIHDVLQGVVGTTATLGVLPLGTANSLAADLGIERNPEKAASQLLAAEARRIAVGQIEYESGAGHQERRYFVVAAGIGADAALFYQLNATFKRRWGMAAYCAAALRLWIMHPFQRFRVDWTDSTDGQQRSEVVTQLLAVRIANFGGVLRKLAPGADLLRNSFRLVLFKTRNRARYLRFVAAHLVSRDWSDPHIELVDASEVACTPIVQAVMPHHVIHAEADGEWLGRLPVRVSLIPDAFNLLVPPTASSLISARH